MGVAEGLRVDLVGLAAVLGGQLDHRGIQHGHLGVPLDQDLVGPGSLASRLNGLFTGDRQGRPCGIDPWVTGALGVAAPWQSDLGGRGTSPDRVNKESV